MSPVLTILTALTVVLLIGILTSFVSNRLRIPHVFLLLVAGVILGKITFDEGTPLLFPPVFVTGMGILALVMIVFDSASRFKLKEFDSLSLHTIWLSFVFLFFNLVILSLFTLALFDVTSIFTALVFAALMSGTDPAAILTMLKNR